jgi:hypothetical protein
MECLDGDGSRIGDNRAEATALDAPAPAARKNEEQRIAAASPRAAATGGAQ